MGPVLPILQYLPTKQNRMFKRLRLTMREIADELLARNRNEKEGTALSEEKSIIGLLSTCKFNIIWATFWWNLSLVKAETTTSSLGMSQEEILAQVHSCILSCLLTFHWIEWLPIDGKAANCTVLRAELKHHVLQNVLLLAGEPDPFHLHPRISTICLWVGYETTSSKFSNCTYCMAGYLGVASVSLTVFIPPFVSQRSRFTLS